MQNPRLLLKALAGVTRILQEATGRLMQKAHVKGHIRTLEDGRTLWIADHDDRRQGRAATLHERTAVGKHKDGTHYVRATDREDSGDIQRAIMRLGLGAKARYRKTQANHLGQKGSYDHFHFEDPAHAKAVHDELRKLKDLPEEMAPSLFEAARLGADGQQQGRQQSLGLEEAEPEKKGEAPAEADAVPEKRAEPSDEPVTYRKAVAENLKQMGSAIHEWEACEIRDMKEVDTGGGRKKMMPDYAIPKDYDHAPSLYRADAGGGVCELCGTPIKDHHWIQNHEKGWVMAVGSECVTHFGAGDSGNALAAQARHKINADLYDETARARRELFHAFTVGREYQNLRGAGTTKRREWRNDADATKARETYDALKKITTDIPHKAVTGTDKREPSLTKANLTKWAGKHKGAVAELVRKANEHMGKNAEPAAPQTTDAKPAQEPISTTGSKYMDFQPMQGEIVTDKDGKEYAVWNNRYHQLTVHPIGANGRPEVNATSRQVFWTDTATTPPGDSYRTDPVYRKAKVGDTMSNEFGTYRLNENHRWEKVDYDQAGIDHWEKENLGKPTDKAHSQAEKGREIAERNLAANPGDQDLKRAYWASVEAENASHHANETGNAEDHRKAHEKNRIASRANTKNDAAMAHAIATDHHLEAMREAQKPATPKDTPDTASPAKTGGSTEGGPEGNPLAEGDIVTWTDRFGSKRPGLRILKIDPADGKALVTDTRKIGDYVKDRWVRLTSLEGKQASQPAPGTAPLSAPTQPAGPKEGDERTIGDRTYRLVNGRWHRVGDDGRLERLTPKGWRPVDENDNPIMQPEDATPLMAASREPRGPRTYQIGEDGLSDDPNAPNYRYKDTGYIGGSRKEAAALRIKEMAKQGLQVQANDVNWTLLEENPREAKALIVKKNVFGDTDWAALRESGMEPGTGFLLNKVYASVDAEPEDSPEIRKDYVVALGTLRERLESAKTPKELAAALHSVASEAMGTMLTAEQQPELDRLNAASKEAKAAWAQQKAKADAAYDVYNARQKDYQLAQRKANRFKKNIPEDLQQEIEAARVATEQAQQEWHAAAEVDSYVKADGDWMKRHPLEAAYESAWRARAAFEQKCQFENVNQTPCRKWRALGKAFLDVARVRNATFKNHFTDVLAGHVKDWSWSEKGAAEPKAMTKKAKRFQLVVAGSTERIGGRQVETPSSEALKAHFNFRDVDTGNYVRNDPTAARFHMEHCAGAMADLADVLGLPDTMLSMKGRLAIGFGARGMGVHTGVAHYEARHRVINITKEKGAGALAHEWFHALDNLMVSAVKNQDAPERSFGTWGNIPDSPEGRAFHNLVKAMTEGEHRPQEEIRWTDHHMDVAQRIKDRGTGSMNSDYYKREAIISRAKNAQEAVDGIDTYYREYASRKREYAELRKKAKGAITREQNEILAQRDTWKQVAMAYHATDPAQRSASVATGSPATRFHLEALAIDAQEERNLDPYWSSPHEMAARAFHAFVEDELQAKGRKNGYLADGADNGLYAIHGIKPFPEGEERERINAAMRDLFETLKSTRAIEKALVHAHQRHNADGSVSMVREHQDGRTLHGCKTEDDHEFRQWMHGAALVHKDGSPVVLFHGTGEDFDNFKSQYGGIYFAPDSVTSTHYANLTPDDGKLLEVATNARSVFSRESPNFEEVLDRVELEYDNGTDYKDPDDDEYMPLREWFKSGYLFKLGRKVQNEVMESLSAEGYDAVRYTDASPMTGDSESVVIFDPARIRILKSHRAFAS